MIIRMNNSTHDFFVNLIAGGNNPTNVDDYEFDIIYVDTKCSSKKECECT